MRMGYDLIIEQQQKLVMTPELQLALKILQLPTIELDALIQHELEANPVLEVIEEHKEERNDKQEREEAIAREKDIDWKEYLQYQGKSYCLEHTEFEEGGEVSYDNLLTYSTTLRDHLLFQLNMSVFENGIREIGEFIIESLDENGYLTMDTGEIAAMLGTERDKVTQALDVIHSFEPFGVGARDLKECLLIQLRSKGLLTTSLEAMVCEHLDDIAANRLQQIAKKLSLSIDEVQKLSDVIKSLEPKPGRAFEDSSETRYVLPDVYIEKFDDDYIITINDHYSSRLIVNRYYRDILKHEDKSSQASVYLNEKLSSALWLIKSLEHRKHTLYNVMRAILDYQMEFFEKGTMYLKTMTLKNIADTVNVHESTVSRAISGKYVQTPRGVFEIKYFFKSGVDNKYGEAISSESIKKIIKSYISSEDTAHPVSDQSIADMLTQKGFVISRRTVAKYRDELGIPASSKRKRF